MKFSKLLYVSLLLTFCYSCKEAVPEKVAIEADSEATLPFFNSPDFTPEWKGGTHKIPAFAFLNQNGDTITNETYKNKIYVADFIFTTCPGICPKLTKNIGDLQEQYKNDSDVLLLSHSVMPWNDTPEVLRQYAKENKVDDKKWNLVTGEKKAIYDIARNGYFADDEYEKTNNEESFIHTENFILVDKNGFIRGVYNGTLPFDVERLKRHIAILKNER